MIKLTDNIVVTESMCLINRQRKMHNSVEDFGKLFTKKKKKIGFKFVPMYLQVALSGIVISYS